MKTMYEVQDMIDGAYTLLEELSAEVNKLIEENERLKAMESKRVKRKMARAIEKVVTEEEQMYLEYLQEQYGKER